MWQELIDVAKSLAQDQHGQLPTQSALRRSVSTSYYALFSATSYMVADTLVGASVQLRQSGAWAKAYRTSEHGITKNAASGIYKNHVDVELYSWANAFIVLQENRHNADYDPNWLISRDLAVNCFELAEIGATALLNMDSSTALDFAAHVAFRTRK